MCNICVYRSRYVMTTHKKIIIFRGWKRGIEIARVNRLSKARSFDTNIGNPFFYISFLVSYFRIFFYLFFLVVYRDASLLIAASK